MHGLIIIFQDRTSSSYLMSDFDSFICCSGPLHICTFLLRLYSTFCAWHTWCYLSYFQRPYALVLLLLEVVSPIVHCECLRTSRAALPSAIYHTHSYATPRCDPLHALHLTYTCLHSIVVARITRWGIPPDVVWGGSIHFVGRSWLPYFARGEADGDPCTCIQYWPGQGLMAFILGMACAPGRGPDSDMCRGYPLWRAAACEGVGRHG